jgi:hypothetical protein
MLKSGLKKTNLKKKNLRICQMFVISKMKIIPQGMELKIHSKSTA